MSNKMINIGGPKNDASYRYQMHALKCKIEGRGNGIKSVITNMTTVAKDLHTDPSYITKFFGMECGAVSKFDKKREMGIINGKRDAKEYQSMLEKFIRDFILCPKCGLPELASKIRGEQLKHKCRACAWNYDNASTHKVKDFIIKHPTASIPAKKGKDKPKKPKGGKGKPKGNRDTDKDTPKKSRQQFQKDESKQDAVGTEDTFDLMGGNNEEVWSVDVSLEAVAKRKQEEMERLAMKGGHKRSREEQKGGMDKDSATQILRDYIAVGERDYNEILDEIKRISMARKYDKDLKKKLEFVLDALCDWNGLDECMECLRKNKMIFGKLTEVEQDCAVFMGVLEMIICKRDLEEEFMGKVYKLLECLYDEDIVDEDGLIQWADMPLDKALFVAPDEAEMIRKKAAPFIAWLRGNDEDEDEEEEGEVEIEGE